MSKNKTNPNIKSWGTVTEVNMNNFTAKLLIGRPEIHRLLMTLREHEEQKSNPKTEIIEALQLLEKDSFNNSIRTIEAEVPIDKRINL